MSAHGFAGAPSGSGCRRPGVRRTPRSETRSTCHQHPPVLVDGDGACWCMDGAWCMVRDAWCDVVVRYRGFKRCQGLQRAGLRRRLTLEWMVWRLCTAALRSSASASELGRRCKHGHRCRHGRRCRQGQLCARTKMALRFCCWSNGHPCCRKAAFLGSELIFSSQNRFIILCSKMHTARAVKF